jgi:FkbH-like protein
LWRFLLTLCLLYRQREPKLSHYIAKSTIVDASAFERRIRIAILSGFTLKGLVETLRIKCSENKVHCTTYVSAYDQYNQDILNKESELYKFSPEICFLLLDTRNILKKLFYSPYTTSVAERRKFVHEQTTDLVRLIKTITKKLNTKLIISNFEIPTYSPYGIFECKTEYGIKQMIEDLNRKLLNELLTESAVYIYDFNSFISKYGEKNVFDYRQFYIGDIRVALDYIPYLAEDLMGYIRPTLGINRKCIVLDLDNTLWGGVVGEDGFEGIKLGSDPIGVAYVEFQQHLLSLFSRGIILAINSKNNPEEALKVIREHPNMVLREENFASVRINWNDKISNMREIAKELNINLDGIVYFDDDPVNRELVSKIIPEVLTIELPDDPSQYSSILTSMNHFNVLTLTDEDTKRGQMYLQRKRFEIEKSCDNLDDFLSQLNLKVKIKKADKFTIPRIAQLTLKTNQFNLTTRRYQEEDIKKFSQDTNMIVGCAQIEDKFGDNGITGAFIIKKDTSTYWTIDTFLLSCRVMGRGVEDAIMGHIINEAIRERVVTIKGQYIPTKRNKPCEEFLDKFGFKKNGEYWIYSIDLNQIKIPKYLELITE